jgi:hypothetical protein
VQEDDLQGRAGIAELDARAVGDAVGLADHELLEALVGDGLTRAARGPVARGRRRGLGRLPAFAGDALIHAAAHRGPRLPAEFLLEGPAKTLAEPAVDQAGGKAVRDTDIEARAGEFKAFAPSEVAFKALRAQLGLEPALEPVKTRGLFVSGIRSPGVGARGGVA